MWLHNKAQGTRTERNTLEDTLDDLRAQWWDKPGSLPIDCWSDISQADGYDVTLRPEPFKGPARLYYVNLGGYDGVDFAEKHRNVFVVAETLPGAEARAIKRASDGSGRAPRRDVRGEQAFALDGEALAEPLYIHLTPNLLTGDRAFTCHFTPIR